VFDKYGFVLKLYFCYFVVLVNPCLSQPELKTTKQLRGNFFQILYCVIYTRWLKKCPTSQSLVSVQPLEIFYQNFRIYSGRIFQRSLKISQKYFHCFKNYSFYSILFCTSKLHRRNGQSLVMFSVQRHSLSKHVLTFRTKITIFHTTLMCFCEAHCCLVD